ncbi:hypothetical protein RclHR1_03980017 [Rhizophagus clarus]|uniref:RNase H type-1 domain-containing protein n=1 Tax=Rhizophagus clarus TaxID=94130 RepID=A0A2Z6RFV0_9GLOM|nr:hypothetical protein RclHR1_03980017 [Rhizophagus clarus]
MIENRIKYNITNSQDASVRSMLDFFHPILLRNQLINIQDIVKGQSSLTIYTDGFFKRHSDTSVIMGSMFKIIETNSIFQCQIQKNPSVIKAELIVIIMILLCLDSSTRVTICTDSQIIINQFFKINTLSIFAIQRLKLQYSILWILFIKLIRFKDLIITLQKVKAYDSDDHMKAYDSNDHSNAVDKLAKEAYKLFDWSLTFRYIKDKFDETSAFDSRFNSFKTKLRAEELLTQDNLCKRSPSVYTGNWRCALCNTELETYQHLWSYSATQNTRAEIVHNSKDQLFNLIILFIQNKVNIDHNDIFININNLDCWNSSNIGILYLVKEIIPKSFSEFLKELKILEQSIYKITREVIDTLVLQFKHLIWKHCNVHQVKLE